MCWLMSHRRPNSPLIPAACAVDDAGQVWCWGSGGVGQLGDGRCDHDGKEPDAQCKDNGHLANVPVAVVGGHKCRGVTAGYAVTCCITAG